jgi:creatinine amidohydrolase/Fe(II)-dependent formamide hydrolase-like protein
MRGLPALVLALAAQAAMAAGPRSVYIEELTSPEVREAIAAGKSIALYYAGSTEQNGPHMTLGKHNRVARYVAGRIAEQLGNALVYPVMPFAPTGDSAGRTGHMAFAGSVSVQDDTFAGVARDVAKSAIAAGFSTVALMGDHGGGQDALRKVAAELDGRVNGARVVYVSDLYFKSQDQVKAYLSKRGLAPGDHAGVQDTSELMFVDAAAVRADKIGSAATAPGVQGDPRGASAEFGRVFIGFKVTSAVQQIRALQSRGKAP